MSVDSSKCLTELERCDWGPPSFPSNLVERCHRLREMPLCDFTADDLRLMILQGIGLPFLLPIALERLRRDPFSAGRGCAGELLCAALRADPRFLAGRSDLRAQLADVLREARDRLSELDSIDQEQLTESLAEATREFERVAPGADTPESLRGSVRRVADIDAPTHEIWNAERHS